MREITPLLAGRDLDDIVGCRWPAPPLVLLPARSGGRLADLGVNDDFMRQAARTLQSGNAALFMLIRKPTTDKVLATLRGAGVTVMRSSFDESKEEALQATLAGARAASAEAGGVVSGRFCKSQ